VILIIIKFGELLLWFSVRIINALRSINNVGLKSWEKNLAALNFFQPTSQCLDTWWNTLCCLMYYFRDTVLLKSKLPVLLGFCSMQIAWWSVTYFWAELCLFVYWAVWRNDLFEITLNLRTGVYSRYRVMPACLL